MPVMMGLCMAPVTRYLSLVTKHMSSCHAIIEDIQMNDRTPCTHLSSVISVLPKYPGRSCDNTTTGAIKPVVVFSFSLVGSSPSHAAPTWALWLTSRSFTCTSTQCTVLMLIFHLRHVVLSVGITAIGHGCARKQTQHPLLVCDIKLSEHVEPQTKQHDLGKRKHYAPRLMSSVHTAS